MTPKELAIHICGLTYSNWPQHAQDDLEKQIEKVLGKDLAEIERLREHLRLALLWTDAEYDVGDWRGDAQAYMDQTSPTENSNDV